MIINGKINSINCSYSIKLYKDISEFTVTKRNKLVINHS
jgi:hypothetical protein